MSDEATSIQEGASAATAEAESFPGSEFNRQELQEFSADDTEATANIGKMLTIFFAYSLLAMMCVTAWAAWIAK